MQHWIKIHLSLLSINSEWEVKCEAAGLIISCLFCFIKTRIRSTLQQMKCSKHQPAVSLSGVLLRTSSPLNKWIHTTQINRGSPPPPSRPRTPQPLPLYGPPDPYGARNIWPVFRTFITTFQLQAGSSPRRSATWELFDRSPRSAQLSDVTLWTGTPVSFSR